MAKTIENLFYYIHFSVNLVVIALFFLYLRNTKKELPLILIAIYAFLESALNFFTEEVSDKLYSYGWSTFTLIEYSIFSFILASVINRPLVKRIILFVSILFIAFSVVYNVSTNFKKFDSIPVGVETILILLFSFYYLYEQMNDTSNLFIYSKYQFWIIIGFMIYLAGSFFVFIFASGLNASNSSLLGQYWLFTNVFYFLMMILFSISLFVNNKKSIKAFPGKLTPYLN